MVEADVLWVDETGWFEQTERHWLWTFAGVGGVEPANHRAERAVRPAVIKRKLSFGTQSADGSRLVERMLTVCQSLRRQGRCVLDFLEDSLLAWRTAQTPPTLVPG